MVGADLGDSVELGRTVAEEDQAVGAGIGTVDHAKAVGARLHVEYWPDLAVDHRERREGLHHLRIRLVEQTACQSPLIVEDEVAVLDQQRHLERRPFGQTELALTIVADDPQPGQAGIDVQLGNAHDMVVVPEQRRPLVHWVVEDG